MKKVIFMITGVMFLLIPSAAFSEQPSEQQPPKITGKWAHRMRISVFFSDGNKPRKMKETLFVCQRTAPQFTG